MIPRSILISVMAVAVIYIAINLSIIGVVPWREFVPNTAHPQSDFIVSIFMERIYGSSVATAFTLLVLWTAFGSVFALLLGYSRIPYAAAVDGTFFSFFAKVHPEKHFPYRSLLLIGLIAIAASTLSLGMVINALITTRILIQFMGQIVAVALLRRDRPDAVRPFKIWLYSLPNLVARGPNFQGEVDKFSSQVLEGLRARGVELRPGQGEDSGVHGVMIRNGQVDGGYDPRREGRVLRLPR